MEKNFGGECVSDPLNGCYVPTKGGCNVVEPIGEKVFSFYEQNEIV